MLNEIHLANDINVDNPINIVFNTKLSSISQYNTVITARTKTLQTESSLPSPSDTVAQEDSEFCPELLVGCDGLNSEVRNWLQGNVNAGERFAMQSISSDSAGLRYKMLTLRPRFLLYRNASKVDKAESQPSTGYAIRSVFTNTLQRMSLGLLPVKGGQYALLLCI